MRSDYYHVVTHSKVTSDFNNKFYTLINSTGLVRCSENGAVVKKRSKNILVGKQKKTFLFFFENRCQIFM